MIQTRAQMIQQRAQQFLMEDPDGQAQRIADAKSRINQAAIARARMRQAGKATKEEGKPQSGKLKNNG